METRRIQVRFKEPVDMYPLTEVAGVAIQSQNGDKRVTLLVEGDLDAVIKALANYPVSDMDLQRQSLEDAFLAYYQDDRLEVS